MYSGGTLSRVWQISKNIVVKLIGVWFLIALSVYFITITIAVVSVLGVFLLELDYFSIIERFYQSINRF